MRQLSQSSQGFESEATIQVLVLRASRKSRSAEHSRAAAVDGFWLLAALGQVKTPPRMATGAIEQVPAVGHQLQPVLQCHQGRVGLPGEGTSQALGTLHCALGLQLLRAQWSPAVAAAWAARVAARQRGWGGWGLLPGGAGIEMTGAKTDSWSGETHSYMCRAYQNRTACGVLFLSQHIISK